LYSLIIEKSADINHILCRIDWACCGF